MPVHVYGVLRDPPPSVTAGPGRDEAPVRIVAAEDLVALVSDVPEEARVRRADLLAHAHVLEGYAAAATVIPMRFGMEMPDDATVRAELLEDRRTWLTEMLAALDGMAQLSVNASYVDESSTLREVLRRRDDLREARTAMVAADAAEQARFGEAVAAELETMRQQDADLIVERLAPSCTAVSVEETKGGLHVTDLALLVPREQRTPLDEAVTDLRPELAPRIELRYIGPQPPYAFLDAVEGGAPWA